MTVVADASAVVAAIVSDRGEAVVARLSTEDELHAPHLLDLEVLSAIRRLHRAGLLDETGAVQARTKLGLLPVRRYPHGPLAARIWELRDNLTVYDATYVALAEALEATLVTADALLAKAPRSRCAIELV